MKPYLFIFLAAVSACSKSSSDKCPAPANAVVYSNREIIYEAATLSLSTGSSAANLYRWTGPGGWTSNQPIPVRTNMQAQHAGIYSVQVYDLKNCLVFTGSKNIQVLPPPPPQCSVSSGAVTSTLPGVGFSFPGGVSAYPYQSGYYYSGVAANGDRIDITFSGTHPPYAGLYKTVNSGSASEDYVFFVIRTGVMQYRSKGGDDVYVNTVAGKRVVTFCNITMVDYFSPAPEFLLTGKLAPF